MKFGRTALNFRRQRPVARHHARRVRRAASLPPSTHFSNHSWGTAIDVKILPGGVDTVGDGKTHVGLAMLHPFFNRERFFWGAGFGGAFEDSMHFEASNELVEEWGRQGLLGR